MTPILELEPKDRIVTNDMKHSAQARGASAPSTTGALVPIDSDLLRGVQVSLSAVLGRGEMTADALLDLKSGAVVTLDASLADHVELYLNDALVARGEIVAVGDHYGVRITDVAPPQ